MARGGKIHLISDIVQRINQGVSLEEVFNLIYDRLREFIPYNRMAVALANESFTRLSIIAARSDGKMVMGRGYSGPIAGSSLESILRDNRSRILNNLEAYLQKKPTSDSTRLIVKEGMRSSLTLPLMHQARPVGVMFFSSREPGAYGRKHQRFLEMIAAHMAVAIERSRLMEELQDKTEFLDNILRNSADAIVVCDLENRILKWNQGAQDMFGFEAGEVLGYDWGALAGTPVQHRIFLEMLKRDGVVRGMDIAAVGKDGRQIQANMTATMLRNARGREIGWSAIIRDLSEIRKLQGLAAVGEMAATVAHEVKNPLAGISGAVEVLRDDLPPGHPKRLVVDKILGQIGRLDRTVRDLLDFARPMAPEQKPLDLRESIDRAWASLGSPTLPRNVRFAPPAAPSITIHADAHLLHQVWVNLMMNAVEAMPQGGDLRVNVEAGPPVRISFHDTGPGVKAETLAKLGQPFFTTKTRGTGLGLAIVRKIVEAHGGTLRLESRQGEGTRAIVEVPA